MARTPVISVPDGIDPEQYLRSLGYSGSLREMVEHYQWFNGLKPDGIVGPVTQALMQNPQRCGMPDLMQNRDCRWDRLSVTWDAQIILRQMSVQKAAQVFDAACRQWNAICGIRLQRTGVSDPARADIEARQGSGRADGFDGPGGTLAWSELPCGGARQLQQRYDAQELWTPEMLLAVACHEIGHAIGIPHIRDGNLMAPYYNPAVTRPQAGDIAEAVRRYGEPVGPVDPVDPTEPAVGHVLVELGGRTYSADLKAAD